MTAEDQAPTGYREAFESSLRRVQQHLAAIPPAALPIRMFIAGGAALRRRATEAVSGYVGDLRAVARSIELACAMVARVIRAP